MSGILSSLTARGRTFIALGIAFLISGTGLGMADLTRIGLLLLALPLLTALALRRHSLTFGVARRSVPARVEVDQPARVELTITNPSRSRSPVMAVEETVAYELGDRPRWVLASLRRDEQHALVYGVRSHVRGRHRLGPLVLTVADPFGLTGRTTQLQSVSDLVVLPRVVPLGREAAGSHGTGTEGTIPHMVALHGEDDVSVRDYRDGDDLRRVHWPATARTGNLMVRQEDRPSMRRAVVLLDSRESAHGPSTSPSLEWAVTMAASVVAHCAAHGYAVHLVTASPDSGIGQAHHRLDGSLEALALVEPGPDREISGIIHTAGAESAAGGLVIAVVGGCTDDEARAVAALRSPGGTGIAFVVDRRTFAAPADGPGAGNPPPLGTTEMLRSAGWRVVVASATLSWAAAWQAVGGSHQVLGGVR
jgi:uncharacterized protein (DUF58 family)